MNTQQLFKELVKLLGLNNAKVADLAGVKRPNLYNWLSGKSQVMSKEREDNLLKVIGVINGKLATEIVHRWNSDKDLSNIKTILNQLEDAQDLKQTEIYFVKTDASATGQVELFSLLRIPRASEFVTILVSYEKPLSTEYPVKSAKLGFGNDMKTINVWSDVWYGWWNKETLTMKDFMFEASAYINTTSTDQTEQSVDKDLIARYENTIRECKAVDAGLRAVIRALLNELRLKAPGSPFLNASVRMKEYLAEYDKEIKKSNI